MYKQVLHMQKPKTTPIIVSIGEENDRKSKEEIAKQVEKNSNIDPRMTQFNKDLIEGIDHSLNLYQRLKKRLAEGYTNKRKIRTDAVKMVDGVYGAGAEFFKGMTLERKYQFGKDFAEFLIKKVGKENIIGCCIHVDEKAGKDENGNDAYGVHIHFQFVPLKDGNLNRKAFGLSRYGLQAWHTECAKWMREKGWELERGEVRQDWQEPLTHYEPNQYKRKHFSDNVPSMKLEKWLENFERRVKISKTLVSRKEMAEMSIKDYESLLEIAKMGIKLKHNSEDEKPLKDEIKKMRKSYSEKVEKLDDTRKELERELAEVANQNEQRKYKRLNAELEKSLMQSDADKKEIADRLQQIKTNQKDAVEIADELIRKLPNELKGKWNSLDVHGQRVLGYLKEDCPELYSQLLRKSQQSILSEMNDRMEQKRNRSRGRSK